MTAARASRMSRIRLWRPDPPHRRRSGRPSSWPRPSVWSILAELSRDIGYLEVKEKLGALAVSERARLRAARSGWDPGRIGGGS
jgi:hypothetical protein